MMQSAHFVKLTLCCSFLSYKRTTATMSGRTKDELQDFNAPVTEGFPSLTSHRAKRWLLSHLSFSKILLLASVSIFLFTFQVCSGSYFSRLLFLQMLSCLAAPCQFRLLGKGHVKLLRNSYSHLTVIAIEIVHFKIYP